ncbi:MAG: transglutaminase family protein [Bacteroidales bacterium]|nr:transglutaminase family protein [Bacteroidales bacterium]
MKYKSFLNLIHYATIVLCTACFLTACSTTTDTPDPVAIGESEKEFTLNKKLSSVNGLAIKEGDASNTLFILDGVAKKIYTYSIGPNDLELRYEQAIGLENDIVSPRGLEFSREGGHDILYFIDYSRNSQTVTSRLCRYNIEESTQRYVDLKSDGFEIGEKEVFGVTRQGDFLYISFDPSGFEDQQLQMRRGIVKFSLGDFENSFAPDPKLSHQLPGPGKPLNEGVSPSLALTSMSVDGYQYLWGTIGKESIYLIDSNSGRGVFFFNLPSSPLHDNLFNGGLAFGTNHLWAPEQRGDSFIIHRINVLDNLQSAYEGPKKYREMRLNIRSTVEDGVENPRGEVYHTFCHPYGNEYTGHQGILPNSLRIQDITNISDVEVKHSSFDPADDPNARQFYTMFTYPVSQHPGIRTYESELYLKFWTREYKQFVYPHLVNHYPLHAAPKYIEDDDTLYRFTDEPLIYPTFYDRVSDYVFGEYGVNINKADPYWIARNTTEYIMENYHYPKDEENFYATYDFELGNYNANPGHYKADLSSNGNYTDNIIACSGTAMLTVGAYRSIGIPSRWHGVTQEKGWTAWTGDEDEFLERDEESSAGNGHRYTEVWLGDFYGWKRFDATPKRPNAIDFDIKPLELSQWELMSRCASGVESKRVIHNMHSEFWKYLYVAFEKGEDINNSGAERYNFLGTYSHPEDFKASRQRVWYRALLFIDNIRIDANDKSNVQIHWENSGEWELDPEAKIQINLETASEQASTNFRTLKVLGIVDYPANSIKVDLSEFDTAEFRIKLHKYGDPATGNGKSLILQYK